MDTLCGIANRQRNSIGTYVVGKGNRKSYIQNLSYDGGFYSNLIKG